MKSFTKIIIVNGKGIWLVFTQVLATHNEKYFIKAVDSENEVIYFELKKSANSWKVVPPAPEWALKMEKEFSDFIEKA